uniref:Uncharacterized protein n=1 Tax=Macaca fascicularis TaxID=9541 RepID=A0A2K5UPR8_MACFA
QEPSLQLERRTASKCAWEGLAGWKERAAARSRVRPRGGSRSLERYSWNKGKHYAGGDRSSGDIAAARGGGRCGGRAPVATLAAASSTADPPRAPAPGSRVSRPRSPRALPPRLPPPRATRCPLRSCPLPRSACLCSRNSVPGSCCRPWASLWSWLPPPARASPAPPMHIWTPSCAPAAQSWAPVTHWTAHSQPPLPTPLLPTRLPDDYIMLPTDLRCHCHRHPSHPTDRLLLLVIWTHLGGIWAGHNPWTMIQTAGCPSGGLLPSERPISSPIPETFCAPATWLPGLSCAWQLNRVSHFLLWTS